MAFATAFNFVVFVFFDLILKNFLQQGSTPAPMRDTEGGRRHIQQNKVSKTSPQEVLPQGDNLEEEQPPTLIMYLSIHCAKIT
ncbi:hypothetical protein DSCO28_30190 [Desulfosarcina ovata subsp. sediminis]|uniref:Uncharacterized protein n=1 Tax=Desulfosarcina ovata subsp. sediminis TaxID=885957 RepID=A0A5K7ZRQ6_9BACT|nr:hypothetical protein [Desulfosarcina ovata]BBO82453.1 hypothetical protein DSCO28_30190 [Desulfosarcina ovata subsp. sediminis]